MTLMFLHPLLEARESLSVAFEACIHASEGAQVPHDHVEVIEFLFYSECIFWILHQLVNLGGGFQHRDPSKDQLRPVVARIFFSHFITLLDMHPLVEAGESLCVAFEACIHASEGAEDPDDQVGMVEYLYFILSVFFGFGTN
jgi:hypothetical protein